MANGNQIVCQFGVESTYGTLPTMTKQIRIASEGFKYTPEKKDEGLLTGGKSTGKVYTMSIKSEGAITTNVRPDEVGYWLGGTFGVEGVPTLVVGSTGAYKHTFTSSGANDGTPSLSFVVDRIVKAYAYTGQKVQSLSFSAQPGDYLKVDVSLVGKDEVTGTVVGGLTVSPLKPFRFSNASVKMNGTVVADVTSIKFEYNNNLDAALQTTSTGLYFKEPEVGARDIKTTLEVIYSTESDDLRTDHFKTDDSLSVEINFTSDELIEAGYPYAMKILIPHNQITDATAANASGAEKLKQSITLKAIEESTDELITAELINGLQTKYI
jgi:hypothetical protein